MVASEQARTAVASEQARTAVASEQVRTAVASDQARTVVASDQAGTTVAVGAPIAVGQSCVRTPCSLEEFEQHHVFKIFLPAGMQGCHA